MSAASKAEAFRFDAETHTYWLGDRFLPSITQILKDQRYIPDYLFSREDHLYRGSYVHWAVRLHNENDLILEDLAPQYRGYVEAYIKLRRDFGIIPIRCEQPQYHPHLFFAGTPDIVTEDAIWELKTGDVLPWAALQTIGQDMLERASEEKPKRRRRFGVTLNVDGTYEKPVQFKDWARDEALFRTLVTAVTSRPMFGQKMLANVR